MIRLMIVICAMAFAPPAWAEQVLVSVARMANATHLVLTFENRPGWVTEDGAQRLDLRFDTEGHEVDIDSSNALVAGSRIARVSVPSDGQRLSIQLACACDTRVYPFGSGSIVVEVRDRPDLADVKDVMPEAPLPPRLIAAAPDPVQRSTPIASVVPMPPARHLATPHLPVDALPALSELSWNDAETGLDVLEVLGFSMRSEGESQAIALLSRELSRAASQGLVEPESDPDTRETSDAPLPEAGLSGRSNISVVTGLDRDLQALRDRLPPTHQGARCISDSEVDLAQWGDTSDFSTLGRLRRDAAAENGDILPVGARAIARYYIALGFGSEAANTASFMEEGLQKDLIEAMAEIVDHGFSAARILDGQIHCDGKVALWAALARPISSEQPPASTDMILSTFSALPSHHRAHLGPVLAERLRSVGLEDAARNAVNAVARGGLQSNESELVTARLELGGTRPDLARDTLVDISNGTDIAAAEALLELLEDAARREMAPNPSWVEDAPSLARATEGTEVAAPLNLAGLRGRIALGQFDEVRAALADDTPGLNDGTRNVLAISALAHAANDADDAMFLRSELGLSPRVTIDDMTRRQRFDVAARLLDLGLPRRAAPYVATLPATLDEAETLAEVYLQTGQPDRAIDVLSNVVEGQTPRKLGEILSATGEVETAILAFERSGAMDAAVQAAIRAGNWAWIAENGSDDGNGILSETARAFLAPPAVPVNPNDPGNGLLVKSSRALRKHAAELLGATQLTNNPDVFTN